jgi:GNAT superfamily N-acetyltransferase
LSDLERIVAFDRDLSERTSELVEASAFGTAFLNLTFAERWSSNLVHVERSLEGVEADALAADADRVLGEHDALRHRRVEVFDDANGVRLAKGFLELGWSLERNLFMVQRREPEPRPRVDVDERSFAEARPVIEAVMREQPYVETEEGFRQLVGFREVLEREAGARFFVASVDGEPAAVCDGYVIGDVGQVEDVNTLERFRGRGLASAIVTRAARWARERGADLVFLVADDEDWPKQLYRRLGFDDLARSWAYTREPER